MNLKLHKGCLHPERKHVWKNVSIAQRTQQGTKVDGRDSHICDINITLNRKEDGYTMGGVYYNAQPMDTCLFTEFAFY